jgi:hypothetical protein
LEKIVRTNKNNSYIIELANRVLYKASIKPRIIKFKAFKVY